MMLEKDLSTQAINAGIIGHLKPFARPPSPLSAYLASYQHDQKSFWVEGEQDTVVHYQVVWVHMAVHPDMWASRRQVADDTAGTRPEILEGILRVDAALDGMPLHHQHTQGTGKAVTLTD